MNVDGQEGRWLGINQKGTVLIDAIKSLPENATLEFDVGYLGENTCRLDDFGIKFFTDKSREMGIHYTDGSFILVHPGECPSTSIVVRQKGKVLLRNKNDMLAWNGTADPFAKIELWRQKSRLRVYINQEKVWDIPRFFSETDKPYMVGFYHNFYEEITLLVRNIRIATAGADTRSALLTEGKFSTNEILFDTNSDKIEPESNTIIKEIGEVLVQNPSLKIKIVGHTDSDGDNAANLALSKKRAEAVKMRLIYGFGINETRISADGKGESEPLNNNNTPEEKAQNRRVEFIKV